MGGDDTLYGVGGDDTLGGGAGEDYLDGGDHNDELHGVLGSDEPHGGAGDDSLYGELDCRLDPEGYPHGTFNDYLNGGEGVDHLFGCVGDDTLDGGNDQVVGELEGGAGADTFVKCYPWVQTDAGMIYLDYFPDDWLDFNRAEGDTPDGNGSW
jgi:Ca2+-binding RTX toxin-like protein